MITRYNFWKVLILFNRKKYYVKVKKKRKAEGRELSHKLLDVPIKADIYSDH